MDKQAVEKPLWLWRRGGKHKLWKELVGQPTQTLPEGSEKMEVVPACRYFALRTAVRDHREKNLGPTGELGRYDWSTLSPENRRLYIVLDELEGRDVKRCLTCGSTEPGVCKAVLGPAWAGHRHGHGVRHECCPDQFHSP